MDNLLRQDFLNRTIATLENLIADLDGEGDTFSEKFRRESFRALHTIKGTAQTLGFAASGRLAHELENLLAAVPLSARNGESEAAAAADYKNLLGEGLLNLKKSFEKKEFKISTTFLERVGAHLASRAGELQPETGDIPDEIFSQLTNAEKGAILSALRSEKDIFCLKIDFNLHSFAEDFVAFRQSLCERCEVIATLPSSAAEGKKEGEQSAIGFRIVIATGDDIGEILEKNLAEIVFRFAPSGGDAERTKDLRGVFERVSASGKTLARRLGKEVEFKSSGEAIKISPALLHTIFDALTHLVRNAVDHAIEPAEKRRARNKPARGIIAIDFERRENGFRLRVADDGRGIDIDGVKTAAIEKRLIAAGGDLPESAALDLIFLPQFSTRASATDISGRGVGLDAVKAAIEKAGGSVVVRSEKGKGTTFEIFLPQ